MDNNEVLGHLLQIEGEAAVLVNEAQAEADRRVAEAEKQSRAFYDERYHKESERLEAKFQETKKLTSQKYQDELDAYKEKISFMPFDTEQFCSLLGRLVLGEK
jgi:regulator of protease activity HflC (stomatin/prohibitin superfamily)